MPVLPRSLVALLLVSLLFVTASVSAAEPFRFTEGEHGAGRLRYVGPIPVLEVAGTPDEIGAQTATLAKGAMTTLVDFPKVLLEKRGGGQLWPAIRTGMQVFRANMPADHLAELKAYSRVTGVSLDRVIAANVMPDAYRGFGCSSLMVEAERSANGGPLFGRNLDFFTLGMLQEYDLVAVVKPKGKHAFVSVGFPGLCGVLSGMNDAGLSLAVHEVQSSADDSRLVNYLGVPYTMLFRRILEECTTVAEAKAMLEKHARTTKLNLAVCDRTRSAVFEITPGTVAERKSDDGLCLCTNHFRTDALCTTKECRRFETLLETKSLKRVGLDELKRRMHAVNQGRITLQSMIFEPKSLTLHLSIDGRPSSKGPYTKLEFAELLGAEPMRAAKESP